MSYRLTIEETAADGIRRICAEQIDRAVAEIDDAELDRQVVVHQVRKRSKKIRGALRLARSELERADTFSRENAWFRDCARSLSHVRDAEALIETWEKLVEHFADELSRSRTEPIRRRLLSRKNSIVDRRATVDQRLADFRARVLVARDRISDWPIESRGFEALQPGLQKTYCRARKTFGEAYDDGSDDAFHQWRKRVKYHWYHCRLLHDLWPHPMRARTDEADRLADMLGDDHDLAILTRILTNDDNDFAASGSSLHLVRELTALRRISLQEQAELLGRRLLAEKPKRLGRRLNVYWKAWRGDHP